MSFIFSEIKMKKLKKERDEDLFIKREKAIFLVLDLF